MYFEQCQGEGGVNLARFYKAGNSEFFYQAFE